jgi:hypothetical protein
MIRDTVKLFLVIPLLACIAAFVYCWAMGIRARFKWMLAKKTSEVPQWREQYIFYCVMVVVFWFVIAGTMWLIDFLSK